MLPAPVSVVISTRIKPGQEAAYRKWERRIAAAQPGQNDSRVIGSSRRYRACRKTGSRSSLRCRSQPSGLARFAGPAATVEGRRAIHRGVSRPHRPYRVRAMVPARSRRDLAACGLEAEHADPADALSGGLPVRNAGANASTQREGGAVLSIALFIGNVVSVVLLNWLVPWSSIRFRWWLRPAGSHRRVAEIAGTLLILALYAAILVAFLRFFDGRAAQLYQPSLAAFIFPSRHCWAKTVTR